MRFRRDMAGRDTGDWMYRQPSNPDWPPDLGYWMGYRIVKTYYEQAPDKRQAVKDILGLTNFNDLLTASRYASQVGD